MKKFWLLAAALVFAAPVVRAQSPAAPTPAPSLVASALKVGDRAPVFSGRDNAGRDVELAQLLKKGPVVLYFYRGQWCPYCNKQLSQLQDSLQLLRAKGAQVVVVSPETPENVAKTVAKTKASFPIVHDQNFAIMKAYHTAFALDEATAQKYRGFGVDLKQANGADADVLPVPATYVIGRDGTVKFAFFDPDYRRRASVRQVLQAL